MLTERQCLLLTLLDALREPVGNTDFQKLLFLYTRECEKVPSYEFIPYKFGAFSFTSYADKRKLIVAGLIGEDEQSWSLTPAGREMARTRSVAPLVVSRFCRARASLRGNALIVEQYRKHPYYAIRSEIVAKLDLTTADRDHIASAKPKVGRAGLLTIGYEGRSLEGYLNQLLHAGATLLCDVRRNPLSRKYGFAKKTLSHACEGLGIRYEHMPELGIDSEDRRDLKTQADYDALFADYEVKSLPQQGNALNRIRAWLRNGERVVLTCYEAQACQCHRGRVAKALCSTGGLGFVPVHL